MEELQVDLVRTFNWGNFESPTIGVVTAVAEESSIDPVNMEPLYAVIDPETLNKITPVQKSSSRLKSRIEFMYQDYLVVIKSDGQGYLYEQ